MRVVSVNVGPVEVLRWGGHEIRTAFRKHAIAGRVALRGVNLEGDDQADRTVHGGSRKTVYVYPSEHYAFWREELAFPRLGWGAFGENLTTSGWPESSARIGDVVRIGSARFEVTQPRTPCYKMNAAFRRSDMIERFHRSGRSGFYLAPVEEGEVGAGDTIELQTRRADAPSIADLLATAAPDE